MWAARSVRFFSARGIWMAWHGVQHGAVGLADLAFSSSKAADHVEFFQCGLLIAVISSHLTGFNNIQGCGCTSRSSLLCPLAPLVVPAVWKYSMQLFLG